MKSCLCSSNWPTTMSSVLPPGPKTQRRGSLPFSAFWGAEGSSVSKFQLAFPAPQGGGPCQSTHAHPDTPGIFDQTPGYPEAESGWEVSEDELWVCGRCACAVHTGRFVSICDSYEKTLGSGCWIGGQGQRSWAGAREHWLVNE